MNGTAVCGEPVVVIEVDAGHVRLKTGRIVSDPLNPVADNRNLTIVQGDRKSWAAVDREKEFRVDDIHLLKASEAGALRDPANAQDWFGSIYEDWIVKKIHLALNRLKV